MGAIGGSAAGGPHRIRSRTDDAVGEAEVRHLRTERASRIDQNGVREGSDVIDSDILQKWNFAGVVLSFDLREDTMSSVLGGVDIIDDHIMNAVALALFCIEAVCRNHIRQLEAAANMTDGVIAEGDVAHQANAAVTVVLGGCQNREA